MRLPAPDRASDGLRLLQLFHVWRLDRRRDRVESLSAAGQPAEAARFFADLAARPDAGPRRWTDLARHLYRAGEFERAAAAYQRARSLWPDPAWTAWFLHAEADAALAASLRDGHQLPIETINHYAALTEASVANSATLHTRAMIAIQAGAFDGAARMALQAHADPGRDLADRAIVTATAAIAFALGGHREQAVQWAKQTPAWCPLHRAVAGALAGMAPRQPR